MTVPSQMSVDGVKELSRVHQAAADCIHMHFQEIGLAKLLLDKKRAEELKNRCSNVYLPHSPYKAKGA